MLKQPLAPPAVRIGGLALVFTLSFGMGFAAWSAQPAGTNVSQAKGRVDFRAQLKINVDDKLASRFSISERFGQPFTVKDNHGGSSIELTGTVRPVTQHGGLFFQIQATVKKDGVPYGTPMMIVGEGNTGSLMVGKKMLDGRFNGVEIAMKITPVDAASALAQAVPYQSPLRVPAPPPSPKAPAVPPVPPAPHLPLPPPVPPVPPAPAGSSSNSAAIAVQTPAPKYPVLTAGQRTDGKVILVVELAADGSVSNAIVEKSEPTDKFGAAALQAVKDWKFKPALKDGKPVPSRVRVPIWFEPVKVPESTPQS